MVVHPIFTALCKASSRSMNIRFSGTATNENIGFDVFTGRIYKEVEKKIQKEEETKENEKWYKKVQNFIVKHKVPFIIGGTILVVAVGSTTYIIIKKRRRSII